MKNIKNINGILKFISTFAVPLGIILYLNFKEVSAKIMLHNIIIGTIGGVDIYVRQLKNRQPAEQLGILGISSNTMNVVFFLLHMLLIGAVLYRPVDPLIIPKESHYILLLVPIVIFGLPWWPYIITRMEMFIIYISLYIYLYFGSVILNKKMLN